MKLEKPRGKTKKKETAAADRLPPDEVLFGGSLGMQEVRQRATKICCTSIPILLEGLGGTGKEILARWIHKQSPSGNGNFVKVNCAAIPESLLESDLFGYEKGAFTGAYATKPGRVELSHNGTLYLDEIADLDLGLQSKLLQFLQDGHFSRIGDYEERRLETRLICSTNRDLDLAISEGTFRRDLFYRINVVRVQMPRLRERREDIPILVEYFLSSYSQRFERNVPRISSETMRYLQGREWLGNIRELENCVARYVVLGTEDAFRDERSESPRQFVSTNRKVDSAIPPKIAVKEAIREMERKLILSSLRDNHWNRRKTAQALRISYRALMYKIRDSRLSQKNGRDGKDHGIEPGQNSALTD